MSTSGVSRSAARRRTPAPGTGRCRSPYLFALGLLALVSVAAVVWLGLWGTPPDQFMGNLVRLIYLHPPVAWVAYLAFGVAAAASLLYLWPRTRAPSWDRMAGASAEVGVVFCALTLVSGSIWGRPTWGVWWTWDARLTSTALLFVLYLGYLALRRVPASPEARGRRCAVAALVAFTDVPISYLSVYWWRSLHQTGTVLDPQQQTHIHGSMAWTLLLGFCAFSLVYAWMVAHRYRLATLEERVEREGLEAALAERQAEAAVGDRRPGSAALPVGAAAQAGAFAAAAAASTTVAADPGSGSPAPSRSGPGIRGRDPLMRS